jgi:arginyl-tRNA--protein-N-Asp/Glu arginylyltransferase
VEKKINRALKLRLGDDNDDTNSAAAAAEIPPLRRMMSNVSSTSMAVASQRKKQRPVKATTTMSPEVESILKQLAASTQLILNELTIDESLQSRAKAPLRYKVVPITATATATATVSSKPTNADNHETVTAVSSICAAIAGPSKGKYQRGALAKQVVERLSLLKHQNKDWKWEAHEKSGQIKCTFVVDVLRAQQQHATSSGGTNGISHPKRQDSSDDMDTDSIAPDSNKDLIADWFQKYHPAAAKMNDTNRGPPYDLIITTIPALESSLQPEVHQLYFEYQLKVHQDPSPLSDGDDDAGLGDGWGDASPSYIGQAQTMLRQTYPDYTVTNLSKMVAAFSSFYRFLVETPLAPPSGEPNQGINSNANGKDAAAIMTGTFHQHYRINGTLIAVGVVDILPGGLSSVYAFYDPAFAHTICPLGKYMILKEIDYCRKSNNKLPYYYLGYYIHSCGKMRYKGDYHPSQLLCPKTYQWVDATEGQATLDKESPERHCCQLYKSINKSQGAVVVATSEEESVDNDDAVAVMESIPLHVGLANLVTVNMLHPNGQEIVRPLVREFVNHVGVEASRDCVLKLV